MLIFAFLLFSPMSCTASPSNADSGKYPNGPAEPIGAVVPCSKCSVPQNHPIPREVPTDFPFFGTPSTSLKHSQHTETSGPAGDTLSDQLGLSSSPSTDEDDQDAGAPAQNWGSLEAGSPQEGNAGVAPKKALCNIGPQLQDYGQYIATTSICMAYFYMFANQTVYTACTAWFVGKTLVMTAGHCVAGLGTGKYHVVKGQYTGRYGVVCCKNDPGTNIDNCPSDYNFNIIDISATFGWMNRAFLGNDGAILLVDRPAVEQLHPIGAPIAYETKADDACYSYPTYYAGYPVSSGGSVKGCSASFERRMFYSYALHFERCEPGDPTVPTFTVRGGACGGMSGGPWLSLATNTVWGILVSGSSECNMSTTPPQPVVNLVMLNNTCGESGICVPCLMNKILKRTNPPPNECNATVPELM
eukprot:jgi/Botrbrau1/10863/Bobra.0025s0040.1